MLLSSIKQCHRLASVLIVVFAISCKKDRSLERELKPDQSASVFAKELYEKWVSYTEDHPEESSLGPNERLNWQKIALRISSDPNLSVNYYVPVLSDDQRCNKALELSFGSEKGVLKLL